MSDRLAALLAHPAVRALAHRCGDIDCHLVGGTLRDVLLGFEPSDLDVSVANTGREIAEALAHELPARFVALGGKDFAAYRLVAPHYEVDLWDRSGMTLTEDLARRDLTINAMALPCVGGPLVDPFEGRRDLAERRLRATTLASFSGDPLRVLRLARFAAQLPGFNVDPATAELASASAPLLPQMAAERIRVELERLVTQPAAVRGFEVLAGTGVYPSLWLGASRQDAKPEVAAALQHWRALDERLRELANLGLEQLSEAELATTRLALSFLALETPLGEAVERWQALGYLTQRRASAIQLLSQWTSPAEDERAARRFLFAAGEHWIGALALHGALATNEAALSVWRAEVDRCRRLLEREGEVLFSPPRLVDGTEVEKLTGISPGPRLGEALGALRAAQVDGSVRTREDAIAFLGRYSGSRSASTSKK